MSAFISPMKTLFGAALTAGLIGLFMVSSPAAELPVPAEILALLRVVEDPEGSVNVRSGPSLQSKVTGQLASGAVVAVEAAPTGDWAELWSESTEEKPRFIHTSRLKSVSRWRQVGGTEHAAGKASAVRLNGFEFRVKAVPFVAKDHKITEDKNGLKWVDGKSPWGCDGGLPDQSLALALTLNGRPVPLPETAGDNLYQPNLDSLVLLTPGDPGASALVLMTNSDGAGGYCVVWSFKNGRYGGRAVFCPF
jgi:hypothetical protein